MSVKKKADEEQRAPDDEQLVKLSEAEVAGDLPDADRRHDEPDVSDFPTDSDENDASIAAPVVEEHAAVKAVPAVMAPIVTYPVQ